MSHPTLVIMAKEPRPGRVKTRLAREIGAVPASAWVRRRLATLARELTDRRWTTCLAVAPDPAVRSALLPPLPRLPQGPGDLGDRMGRVFRSLPRAPVLIIGTDIPQVTAGHIADGFRLIGRAGAVVGPATDGGFWAVGLDTRRRVPADLFTGVRWSSDHALADTLVTLPRPAYLPRLADVDTAADLARLSD
jgi:glycosyltransferase A (GT-A) superfamily protein (DUF2064 family)